MKIIATGKIKDDSGEVIDTIEAETEYDFGSNIDEASELFGADIVFSNFRQAAIVALQSRMRTYIAAGLTGDDFQAKVNEWKPGVKNVNRKSKVDKIRELTAGMSAEDVAALLESIQGDDSEE